MSAAATGELPEGDRWVAELKWDVARSVIVDHGAWRVRSRPGRCMTAEFPELGTVAAKLAAHRVVLDGELVCLGSDGKPDFYALRPRINGRTGAAATSSLRLMCCI